MAPLGHRNRLVAQEWRLTFRVEQATSKQPSEFHQIHRSWKIKISRKLVNKEISARGDNCKSIFSRQHFTLFSQRFNFPCFHGSHGWNSLSGALNSMTLVCMHKYRLRTRFPTFRQLSSSFQSLIVQKVNKTIRWINLYPQDSAIGFSNTYPLSKRRSGWAVRAPSSSLALTAI